MAASHPPMRRMQQIDSLLRDRRYPDQRALAARLEVTPRTVLRDIAYQLISLRHGQKIFI